MNREHKFRGKRTDNGEWVEGACMGKREKYIIPFEIQECFDDGDIRVHAYEVDPDTVGEFTGLQDKNLKDIYEGDIINNRVVVWSEDFAEYVLNDNIGCYVGDLCYSAVFHEILGNVHDNPELLKGGD